MRKNFVDIINDSFENLTYEFCMIEGSQKLQKEVCDKFIKEIYEAKKRLIKEFESNKKVLDLKKKFNG